MKLEIKLDDIGADYGETIADLIKAEIENTIQREVRRIVAGIVKDNIDHLRDRLAEQMRNLPPKAVDDYLTSLSRGGKL